MPPAPETSARIATHRAASVSATTGAVAKGGVAKTAADASRMAAAVRPTTAAASASRGKWATVSRNRVVTNARPMRIPAPTVRKAAPVVRVVAAVAVAAVRAVDAVGMVAVTAATIAAPVPAPSAKAHC